MRSFLADLASALGGKGFSPGFAADLAAFGPIRGLAGRVIDFAGRDTADQDCVLYGVGVALLALGAFGHGSNHPVSQDVGYHGEKIRRGAVKRPEFQTEALPADTWGMVTVLNDPHEVRIYQREQINKLTGERRSDSSSAIGGYVALECNEVRCDEKEPTLQSRLPK